MELRLSSRRSSSQIRRSPFSLSCGSQATVPSASVRANGLVGFGGDGDADHRVRAYQFLLRGKSPERPDCRPVLNSTREIPVERQQLGGLWVRIAVKGSLRAWRRCQVEGALDRIECTTRRIDMVADLACRTGARKAALPHSSPTDADPRPERSDLSPGRPLPGFVIPDTQVFSFWGNWAFGRVRFAHRGPERRCLDGDRLLIASKTR
jgi:hypothetical protein